MLKWLLIAGGAVLALVLVVVVVGLLLPREHVASSTVVLRQPPDSVWAVVRSLGAVDAWWPEITRVEPLADALGREGWRQHMKSGYPLPLVVTEDRPPARLVTEIASAPGAPFGGTWTYDIEPAEGGSRVTIIERGWIANPIFRFMANVFFGMHGTMDGYLRALGRRFGEDVTPVHL
jgi:uncharacterized protein YndB with AHSA1/START domain